MDVKENVTETTILNKNKEAIPLHGIMQNSDEMEPSPMSTSDTVYLFAAQDEDTPRRSNIFLTSFNCINSILGSGIIAMPYAIYRAGPIFGLILMALMALLTDYSLVILVKAGGIIGVNTYQELVRASLGRPGFYFLTFIQFCYPLIAMISYNVIIGDNITKVFVRLFQVSADSIISNRNFVVVLTTILVTLPLSLFRNIARLAKASILSVLLQIAILISMLIRWVDMSNIVPATSSDWKFANYGISEAVGILAFAFLCHHNSFLLYQSLENPTEKRWGKVVHISLICSGITAGVFAIIGYSTFRNSTQGDVLENYCFNDDLMNSVRAMFAVTIMLTYPIECFVTRTVLENSIFSNMQPQPVGRHLAETFTIVFITVVLSMTTDCLGVVLEFNGLITALPLAFILPFLSYIRVEEGNLLTRKKILPLFFCSLAIVTMIFGIIWGIYKYSVYGIQCSHGVEMPYCQKELSSNVSFVFSTTQSTTIRIST